MRGGEAHSLPQLLRVKPQARLTPNWAAYLPETALEASQKASPFHGQRPP